MRCEEARTIRSEDRRKIVAKEERRRNELLAHHRQQTEHAEQSDAREIDERRRENAKRSAHVEALERDGARRVPLLEQTRRDEQPAERKEEIDTMRSARNAVEETLRAVRLRVAVTGMARHHAQDGDRAPAIQRGDIALQRRRGSDGAHWSDR